MNTAITALSTSSTHLPLGQAGIDEGYNFRGAAVLSRSASICARKQMPSAPNQMHMSTCLASASISAHEQMRWLIKIVAGSPQANGYGRAFSQAHQLSSQLHGHQNIDREHSKARQGRSGGKEARAEARGAGKPRAQLARARHMLFFCTLFSACLVLTMYMLFSSTLYSAYLALPMFLSPQYVCCESTDAHKHTRTHTGTCA
eukprot:1147706-Pelagomonas_calceolata.AAC.2